LFDEDGLLEVQRKFFGTFLNTYSFFALYAGIDGFKYEEQKVSIDKREEIDRWILSKLNSLIADYENMMDDYNVTKAARAVSEFTIDHLSNWYVRRCRRRFWKSEMNENKLAAYQTLYECLETICKLTAPFAPFISEEIFQNLNSITKKEKFESVHLSDFPDKGESDIILELKMDIAQKVVYLTRAIRAKANLKVRQPLRKILVAIERDKHDAVLEMKSVILDEVNIKCLEILEDESSIVKKSAKPDFKVIGPKFGKNVKAAVERINNLTASEIKEIEKGLNISIEIEGENLSITSEDVEIVKEEISGWAVEYDGGITVAVNTELSNELIAEGLAREFVNRIQNMRKDAGFEVTDKINVLFSGNNKLADAIKVFSNYISTETLAEKLEYSDRLNGGYVQDWKIGAHNCKIQIEKISS
jgi:isoleucyl-tRNA synthetase